MGKGRDDGNDAWAWGREREREGRAAVLGARGPAGTYGGHWSVCVI